MTKGSVPSNGFGLSLNVTNHLTALALFCGISAVLALLKSQTLTWGHLSADVIFEYMDLTATIIFAVGGAIVGVRAQEGQPIGWKRELVICTCAFLTANGGGTFRDLLALKEPFWMTTWIYALLPIVVGSLASRLKVRCSQTAHTHLSIMDNMSAGVFMSSGVLQAAAMMHPSEEGFILLAMVIGTVTAVGGGLIRDLIILRRPPTAIATTYGLAAFAGSILMSCTMSSSLYAILESMNVPIWVLGTVLVFLINELTANVRTATFLISPGTAGVS